MPHPWIDLDHNATTAVLPEVAEVVARHWRESYGNPGSRHAAGRRARIALEDSRESLAHILGAEPDEVIFTSGGTESNQLALQGLLRGGAGAIALTPGEHPSVMETCQRLAQRGHRLAWLPLDEQGLIRPEGIAELPWPEVRLATALLAHNETGVVQDVAALAQRCQAERVPLHLDGVQAVGKIPVDFHALGAVSVSLGAHKFHGPRGVGALLVRRGCKLTPQLVGGHQEADQRAGTEPVPLIAGMTKALELWHADWQARTKRMSGLRDRLQQGLAEQCAPAVVIGQSVPRLPNTLSIAFPGLDGEALLVALDLAGVCCSLGSTCASGSAEPAPVLVAMGCVPEVYRSAVRFSVGIDNTESEIEQAIARIVAAVRRLREI